MIWPTPSRDDEGCRGCMASGLLSALGFVVLVVAVIAAAAHFVA
jgi:hypothetical protein